ncbi:TIM barrel protein [Methanomassiliicoccales archaeon LGM-DZ1]|jgi:hypothetical protein|nr:TIM barrel protein [Methanomassiliicoccales archaeon LGM-DZ1]
MKHLHSWSVFEPLADVPGEGPLGDRLAGMGIGGLELFTLVSPVGREYVGVPGIASVHLPYAIDWHSAWEGRSYEGTEGEDLTYFSFGRDRDEMVSTVRKAIRYAAAVKPAYGVMHAGNTDMRQVLKRKHESDDLRIIEDFAELMNRVVSPFPLGEPPFTLAFENLWWEGLKLRGPGEWKVLERKLEFDNWGFTLDTGHLMNTIDGLDREDDAVDAVLAITDRYPLDMDDRIMTVHLQLSLSGDFRRSIKDDGRHDGESWKEFTARAYKRASEIDQHRPFTSPRVREIIDSVRPRYLTHELYGSGSGDRWGDLSRQRSLFP